MILETPPHSNGLTHIRDGCVQLLAFMKTSLRARITIPEEMLGGPYVLTVDGGGPSSIETVSNGTHTTISFTYLHQSHDNHDIEIVGTSVIPEFSAITILTLLVTMTIAAVALLKRKYSTTK
jgi:hypothetical protein